MATLAQIQAISKRIKPYLKEIPVSNQGRYRISAALLLVADCHFQAILYLLERKLFFASAFALIRPLVEASLRGAWALHCNDEDAVEAARRDDKFPMMSDAIERLEKMEGFACGTLSKVFSPCKKVFHSYTHGGTFQVLNHLTEDAIEPNFPQEVIDEAMTIAAFFGLFTAANVALLAGNEDLAEKISDIFEELE